MPLCVATESSANSTTTAIRSAPNVRARFEARARRGRQPNREAANAAGTGDQSPVVIPRATHTPVSGPSKMPFR